MRAHEGGCFGLAFTRVGDRMASCGADKTVKLWEPGSGALTGTLHVSLDSASTPKALVAAT